MEKLLAYLGVMSQAELSAKHAQGGGHGAPWLIAARALASGGETRHLCRTWAELWDVLRWYAHNRGYDGNERWATGGSLRSWEECLSESQRAADIAAAFAELGIDELKGAPPKFNETEPDEAKLKRARYAMEHGVPCATFAEAVCKFTFECQTPEALHEAIFGGRMASATLPDRRFKSQRVAFPRRLVENELIRFCLYHREQLGFDERLIRLLLAPCLPDADKRFLREEVGIKLPDRYEGGLLFGQLVPRFDNRIIGECPISGGKLPMKNCSEFLDFRWAMTLANIRVGIDAEPNSDGGKMRPLTAGERRRIDAKVRALGFLKIDPDKVDAKTRQVKEGRNELRQIVVEATGCDRHNLDALLLHPDAKESLRHVPVRGSTVAFRAAWRVFDAPCERDIVRDGKTVTEYLDDPLRQRFVIQLLRGNVLTTSGMIAQLEGIGRPDVADRIRASLREEVTDKRGKVNEARMGDLLEAEFSVDKLKGRARFARELLRAATQQVFQSPPVHPLEKGGVLEQTDEVKRRALLRSLPEQTNNHLVRHRLLILRRLFDDLVGDPSFAAGDRTRVERITVEVARDLQTMSGMTNKAKAKELTMQLKNHHEVAEELAEKLRDADGNPLKYPDGRPVVIGAGLIRKARILDDLGRKCPYTGRDLEWVNLLSPRYVDKDHIIPRSQRLSDALEAQVITFKEVNKEKKNRTALQFIRDMNLPENRAIKDRLGIFTEAQFRDFVENLKTKGGHERDQRRRELRKEYLLLEKYEEKDFTPGDLTKTSHLAKLGAQQLEAVFLDMPEAERPPVIAVTGAVTKCFRDRSWKMLPLLGAANEQVTKALAEGEAKRLAGGDFNPKKTIRGITNLHHALDATALALVTARLVPRGWRHLDGELCRFIVKGRLTKDERDRFETLAHEELRLPRFYQWRGDNEIFIPDLDTSIKQGIRVRLAEKRVVQHVPVDMSGLRVEENTRGLVRMNGRRAELKPPVKGGDVAVSKIIGANPLRGHGKLSEQRGVRVITDNYGVAILDDAAEGADRFAIIPWHKVWTRIHRGWKGQPSLKTLNGGRVPRILRNGMRIRIGKFEISRPVRATLEDSEWMVSSIGDSDGSIMVDLKPCDVVDIRYDEPDPKDAAGKKTISKTTPGCKRQIDLQRVYDGGLELLDLTLAGGRKVASNVLTE